MLFVMMAALSRCSHPWSNFVHAVDVSLRATLEKGTNLKAQLKRRVSIRVFLLTLLVFTFYVTSSYR